MDSPASAASTLSSGLDLEALIGSLPACKRCRECRRGCDTLLPKCRQCTKANVDCIFFDHGRNEFQSRSYISGLVDHVRRLSQAAYPSPMTSDTPSTVASSSTAALYSPTTVGTPSTVASSSTADAAASDQHHHEHHFADAGGSYRYLGANSCLVKSPKLQQSQVRTPTSPEDHDWELVWKLPPRNHDLVLTYLDAIQPLYPILHLDLRFLAPDVPPDLAPAELFCLNMIYSIACYLEPEPSYKGNPSFETDGKLDLHRFASEKYRCLAETFFNRAMEHLEAATVEPTMTTLRAVLLLAINTMFDPKSGNIGQQIALASRLALNLEAKLDLHDVSPKDMQMMRNMHATIFIIENMIASTLDRPAFFPEPDWHICFDKNQPSVYLCSLYRLQHRYRKGDHSVKALLPPFDEYPFVERRSELLPGLRMSLHQTHLLLNPCWGSAWHVLEAAVAKGSIHIFLTPHWVYRAGCVLAENMPHIWEWNLIQLYSNALVILELSSSKWPNSGILRDSLVDLMDRMKTKYRPPWEAKGVQLYDYQSCLTDCFPESESGFEWEHKPIAEP